MISHKRPLEMTDFGNQPVGLTSKKMILSEATDGEVGRFWAAGPWKEWPRSRDRGLFVSIVGYPQDLYGRESGTSGDHKLYIFPTKAVLALPQAMNRLATIQPESDPS